MLTHSELLKHHNYLLRSYQLEIYKQLATYMNENNLKKKDIAEKLNVSNAYVSQILNGEFNFTLKKLIELGLAINKVPYLEFISPSEYWRRDREGTVQRVVHNVTYQLKDETRVVEDNPARTVFFEYHGGMLPNSVTKVEEVLNP